MKLTAIILAGGKSSRMGVDKGLMPFKNKPMVQHVIDAVKPFVDHIIIITNQKEYATFGYPIYKDILKEKGPLAGIYTGLQHSKTTNNIVVSCDVPFINEEILNLLLNNSLNFDVVIPEKDSKTHQLIGLYKKSCSTIFKNQLDKDELKLKTAIKKLNYHIINADHINAQIFNNINSKDDIKP